MTTPMDTRSEPTSKSAYVHRYVVARARARRDEKIACGVPLRRGTQWSVLKKDVTCPDCQRSYGP